MKQQITGLVALAISFLAIGLHFFKKPSKIAYAETSVLLSEFGEAVSARKKFEESQKDWDKNISTLNDSLTSAVNRMKQKYDIAGKAEKDSMRANLAKRNEDLQRYSATVKNMSQDREKELMEPVVKKMNSFLALWGKEHGYDLILGTLAGGNILQANEGINLTARILKDLNEHYREIPKSEATTAPAVSATDTKIKGTHEAPVPKSIAAK